MVLGAGLPKTAYLFARVGESEDATVDPAKPFYGRKRPFLANPDIKPLVRPSTSGSYPSGHATRVTAGAIILASMLPEKRDAIWTAPASTHRAVSSVASTTSPTSKPATAPALRSRRLSCRMRNSRQTIRACAPNSGLPSVCRTAGALPWPAQGSAATPDGAGSSRAASRWSEGRGPRGMRTSTARSTYEPGERSQALECMRHMLADGTRGRSRVRRKLHVRICAAVHGPPRAAVTPRAFRPAAIERRE